MHKEETPNTNFLDNDNDLRLSMKIHLLDQNVVEFDMQAESGRLIVGLRLADEIRNDFL